jgi:hypothetical protein
MFLISLNQPQWWFILLAILTLIVWIAALVSVVMSDFKDSTTKLMWVLIILLGSLFGALLYFVIGRTQAVHVGGLTARSAIRIGIAIIIVAGGIIAISEIGSCNEHAATERRSEADIKASHAYFDSLRKAQDTAISTSRQ